eukprot:gene10492-11621_t
MTTTNSEPSSWSELVKQVDRDRKQLPWDPQATKPVERVSIYHRKRAERELDPIAMQFRDPHRETSYQETKDSQLQKKAEDVHRKREESFNIINHAGGGIRRADLISRDLRPGRSCHPISNLLVPDHQEAPLLYDEDYYLTHFKPHNNSNRDSLTRGRKDRDFSIISNQYYQNHQQHRQEDFNKLKEHLLEKYWNSHDYDMIKGRYYSPEKERQYQQQEKTLRLVHGRAQEERLPPAMKFSDGNSYNILTHASNDEERLQVTMTMANRSLNRMNKLEKERRLVEEANQRSELDEQKRKNKISFKHWENQIDRGYNFITNEVVTNPPVPSPARPVTMWARLTAPSVESSLTSTNVSSQQQQQRHGIAMEGNNSPAAGVGGNFNNNSLLSPHVSSGRPEGIQWNGMSRDSNRRGNNNSGEEVIKSVPSRASTSIPKATSARGNAATTAFSLPRTTTAKAVPALDLSTTEFAEPVSYKEPLNAPPGLPIPIVRTGGLSAHK